MINISESQIITKNIAFLIPVYPPHFAFARELLESFYGYKLDQQADLWFIFTDDAEADLFGAYDFKIVLQQDLQPLVGGGGIINIKKFFGLKQLQDKYEYIIVLDAESLFIKEVNLYALCSEYFSNKILLGNFTTNMAVAMRIHNKCRRFFNRTKASLLAKKIDRAKFLYLWFNQPCIYKTASLDNFWKQIDYDAIISSLGFFDFDYYIYMYYLLLYEGFERKSMGITADYGACESAFDLLISEESYKDYPILLSSPKQLVHFDNPKCFLTIQLDRRP